MASPLEGGLAKTIGKAMGALFYGCTVVRETPGSIEPPFAPWNPAPPSTTLHGCKGMVDTYSLYERQNTLIQSGDVKILILAASLPIAPTPEDKVTIRGVTYSILDVSTDPARAVWTLQGRGVGAAFVPPPPIPGLGLNFSLPANSGYLALLEDI